MALNRRLKSCQPMKNRVRNIYLKSILYYNKYIQEMRPWPYHNRHPRNNFHLDFWLVDQSRFFILKLTLKAGRHFHTVSVPCPEYWPMASLFKFSMTANQRQAFSTSQNFRPMRTRRLFWKLSSAMKSGIPQINNIKK